MLPFSLARCTFGFLALLIASLFLVDIVMESSYGPSSPPGRHQKGSGRDISEKRCRGRIARKGMTCKKVMVDGKRIEVVVLRKCPEGGSGIWTKRTSKE